MTLVLDTSILIDLERAKEETIVQLKKIAEEYPAPARITFMSEFEFLFGINLEDVKKKDKAREFVNKFSTVQTTKRTASLLAELRRKYERKGVSFSLADLIIASLVIENNFILLTKDNDFSKIEELNKIILEN
ncbi:MAG: type II toxin-antitoxin system VapC family toxin [Candidatus Nanoarchaeia archaeon]